MKLKLAVIALALVVGLNARAESRQSSQGYSSDSSSADSQVHLGVIGGLSLANTYTSNYASSSYLSSTNVRTGFAGGLFANYSLVKWFSLEPQLLYIQKGAVSTSGTTILRYDTVSLPILSSFKFGSDVAKVVLFVGPSIDVAVNKQVVINGVSAVSSTEKDLDISIHGGVGGEFSVTDRINLLIKRAVHRGPYRPGQFVDHDDAHERSPVHDRH